VARKKKGKKRQKKKDKPPKLSQPQPQPKGESPKRMSQFSTIVSIAIGLLGLLTLIQLFPQLSASASNPLTPGNIVASIQVTNEGYTKLTDFKLACYLAEAQIGGMNATDVLSIDTIHIEPEIKSKESYTVPCTSFDSNLPPNAFQKIDIAAIVSYRLWPWPLSYMRGRRVFRFVALPGDNGLNWFKQPSAPIEGAIKKAFEKWAKTDPRLENW
jgi:hypothetical protein